MRIKDIKDKQERVRDLVLGMRRHTLEQVNQLGANGRKLRVREYVTTRQMVYKLCLDNDIGTQKLIGLIFDQDHATVLHGRKTINNLIDVDNRFRAEFKAIESAVEKELTEVLFDWVEAKDTIMNTILCLYKGVYIGHIHLSISSGTYDVPFGEPPLGLVGMDTHSACNYTLPSAKTYNEAKQWIEAQFLEFRDKIL